MTPLRRTRRRYGFFLIVTVVLVNLVFAGLMLTNNPVQGQAPAAQPPVAADVDCDVDVLIFSKTAAFRHTSISAGITALQQIASSRGWTTAATENASLFTQAGYLDQFDVAVFLSTTGDFLNNAQQTAFENWYRQGNGFVGIHGAGNGEPNWQWYEDLLGTYFDNHPSGALQFQDGDLYYIPEQIGHPAIRTLSEGGANTPWTRNEEWYNFEDNPVNRGVTTVLRVDPNSYQGSQHAPFHPISWYKLFDGGRSFYTAMGHSSAAYSETNFRNHLEGAIEWASGNCDTPAPLVLSSPTGTITTTTPTYTWNDNGADTYGFYLDDAANDGNPIYAVTGLTDDAICNGTTCSYTPSNVSNAARLPANGNYIVGLSGSFGAAQLSTAGPFTFTLQLPAPSLSSPTGTITNGYGNPTYTWNDTGAASYGFYLDDAANDTNPIFAVAGLDDDDICNGTTCSFNPISQNEIARLNANGGYVVYLSATYPGGATSTSGPFAFTLNAAPPAPPTLQSTSGTNTARPTLNWTLPGSAANISVFEIYVFLKAQFDVGNFTAPVFGGYFTRIDRCGSASNTTCSLQATVDLQHNTAYALVIRGYGPGGWSTGGTFSNGWDYAPFTVTLPVPSVVSGVQVNANQGRPTIRWNDQAAATTYFLYIYNNTANVGAFYQQYAKSAVCSGGTCEVTDQAVILGNGSYSAYVYACGNAGCSSGGEYGNGWGGGGANGTWSYNYNPPALVTQGSMNASYSGGAFNLSWTSQQQTTWYYVWIGTANAATTHYLTWHSSDALNCRNSGQTCTLSVPLAVPAGQYYFAVQSAGPGGFSTGGPVSNGFQVRETAINVP
ncbi:MAG: ThuA domain-containing protein [bacterium]|nr:ThuA domain-containing protein [bacterium]